MKNLTLENLTLACKGKLFLGDSSLLTEELAQREAAAVVLDSRLLVPGGVFIATRGERVDGHRFIPEVFGKGAMAVICETLPDQLAGPCILVEDSFQALKKIAAFYRSSLSIKVIGVTGSVGKTSTKECIAAVLSTKYRVWKTQGNYNNEVGLPLTILQIREEHELAVLEMGINQFGEMHRLSEIARPDICVITNIGECHLETLGDRKGVLKAKTEILDFWNPKGLVCVNGDDDQLITLKERLGDHLVTFGRSQGNDYYPAKERSRGLLGSCLQICGRIEVDEVEIPIPGEHMIMNALSAAAVADALGLCSEEIRKGMKSVASVKGRSHILSLGEYILIDDSYNANPVSMKAALDLLQQANGRRVAILGDMFELGEEEERLHEEIGAYAAEGRVDELFCVGKLSYGMYRRACEVCGDLHHELHLEHIHYAKDKEEACQLCKGYLRPGDTILLKASHGMHFEEMIEEIAAI